MLDILHWVQNEPNAVTPEDLHSTLLVNVPIDLLPKFEAIVRTCAPIDFSIKGSFLTRSQDGSHELGVSFEPAPMQQLMSKFFSAIKGGKHPKREAMDPYAGVPGAHARLLKGTDSDLMHEIKARLSLSAFQRTVCVDQLNCVTDKGEVFVLDLKKE